MSPPKALKVQLSQAQIREIEAAALLPIAADADCPEIDPREDAGAVGGHDGGPGEAQSRDGPAHGMTRRRHK